MRKKQIIRIIGVIAVLISLVLSGNHFLYAEEASDEDALNTEEKAQESSNDDVLNTEETAQESSNDALDTEESENNEEINIQKNESEEVVVQSLQTYELDIWGSIYIVYDLSVKIDGVPYLYSPDEFLFNKLTFQLDDSAPHTIELHSENFQLKPSVISVNPANSIRKYRIESLKLNDHQFLVYGEDGTQKDVYDNDETVTVFVLPSYLEETLYYRIDGGAWVMSDSDTFKVHARSKKAHEISVDYYIDVLSFDEANPDEDSFRDPVNMKSLTIQFAAAPGENPEDPEDEIECRITEMDPADYEKYQRVIVNLDEFKDLEDNHIVYYQAGLFVKDVQVQPNGIYELVLPYPQGTSKQDEFVIAQFKDGNTDHPVTLAYTADDDGIHVKVDNVSVFVVGWKDEKASTLPEDKPTIPEDNPEIEPTFPTNQSINNANASTTGGVNTGDIFGINLWLILAIVSCFSVSVVLRKKFHNIDHS